MKMQQIWLTITAVCLAVDGCIELTGGVPERVRNLSMFLSEDSAVTGANDRLFFDLVRASQVWPLTQFLSVSLL